MSTSTKANRPILSLVVPAYNEATRLPRFLSAVRPYCDETFGSSYEVIVVDDGSDDVIKGHWSQAYVDWSQLKLIRREENLGKGAAVRLGMGASQGLYRLFADADGATPISEEVKLRDAIRGGADLAVGSRMKAINGARWGRIAGRRMMGAVFRHLCARMFCLDVVDTQCGFKMFRPEAAARLFEASEEVGYLLDVELLLLARAFGLTVAEVDVAWSETAGSKVRLARDSLQMFVGLCQLKRRMGGSLSAMPFEWRT